MLLINHQNSEFVGLLYILLEVFAGYIVDISKHSGNFLDTRHAGFTRMRGSEYTITFHDVYCKHSATVYV
jgi:hypothetical protein